MPDFVAADLQAPAAPAPEAPAAIERLSQRDEARSAEVLAPNLTEATPLGAVVDRIALGQESLREAQAEIRRQLDDLSQRVAQESATDHGRHEARVADERSAALVERVEAIGGRLDVLNQRVDENPEMTITHLRVIEGRLHQLEATLAPPEDEDRLRRLEEITERLGRLEEQFVGRASTEQQGLTTLERRIEEMVERLTDRADHEAELRAELATAVAQIGVALQRADESNAEAGRTAAENEELRRRSDQMAASLEQVQAIIDEERARTKSESATLGLAHNELAGTYGRLAEQVACLAEQAGGGHERLEALDRRVDEALAGLRQGLATAPLDRQESVADAARLAENEELRRRSDQMAASLEPLRAMIDEERARTKSELATLGQADNELSGTYGRLAEQVGGLAAQAGGDHERLEALDRRVDEALAGLQEGLAGAGRAAAESEELRRQSEQMAATLEQVQAMIDEERARTKSESATLGQAHNELAGTCGRLTEQVESLAAQAGGGHERLEALDRRVDEAVAELRVESATAVAQIGVALERADEANADAARIAAESEELRRQSEQMAATLEQVQAMIDEERARTKSESATLGQAHNELAGTYGRLTEQVESLAAQAGGGHERLEALDRRVDEALAGLREGLATAALDRQEGMAGAARIAAENEELRRQSEQMAASLEQLRSIIDEERARTKSESATLGQAHHVLTGTYDRLAEQVESLAAQAGGDQERLEGLDRRVDEALAGLHERMVDAARIAAENEELRRRSDHMAASLLQLQAIIDEERARTKSESATLGQAHNELAGTYGRLAEQVEGLAQQAGGGLEHLDALDRRVDEAMAGLREGLAGAGRVAAENEELRRRSDQMAARVDLLWATLDEELAGRTSEYATTGQAHHELAVTVVRLTERVERLAEQAAVTAEAQERVEALDRRMDEALVGIGEGLAAAALDGRESVADAARIAAENEELRWRSQRMAARLDHLQATIDEEWARTKSESATLGQAHQELAGTFASLTERVESLAERSAGTGDDQQRLESLSRRVDKALARLNEVVEAQRQEPHAARAAISPPKEDVAGRVGSLEQQARQTLDEVSALNELHAALDAGLGALRAELCEVRTAMSRMPDGQAGIDDVRSVPEGEQGKGRRGGRKGESAFSAVRVLLGEQRRLREQLDAVQRAADAATGSADRATGHALSLGPIRSELKLLHLKLAEQNDVLERLGRSVEGLRRQAPAPQVQASKAATTKSSTPPPTPRATRQAALAPAQVAAAKRTAPAAKRPVKEAAPAKKALPLIKRAAPAAKKAVPPAKKAVLPVKNAGPAGAGAPAEAVPNARGAAARAAIARAAAAQAAREAPKAPAARAPRAKKA